MGELAPFKMPGLMVGAKVYRPDGSLVYQLREEGHSWTRNGWNFMLACMSAVTGDGGSDFGAGHMSSMRDSGQIDSHMGRSTGTAVMAPSTSGLVPSNTDDGFGILVGSGDADFSVEDYILANKVSHGTGAGQMEYRAELAPQKNYDTIAKKWAVTHSREFLNSSGAPILIKEMGLGFRGTFFGTAATEYLLARDVLSAPVEVANEQLLVMSYEIIMDFSGIDP